MSKAELKYVCSTSDMPDEGRGAPCGDSPKKSDKSDDDPSSEEPAGAGAG